MSVVMVYGGGAREHALVWRLAQCPSVTRLIAVGGSPAWVSNGKSFEVWDDCSFGRLAKDARASGVDLLVVGPDQALSDGIADVFRNEGIDCFGPSQSAARVESSKSFAKELMKSASVPTAEYVVCSDPNEARRFLKSAPWNKGWVLKADGLALGKGVVVPDTVEQAIAAVPQVFKFSKSVVIEERLEGVEVSWFALVAGATVRMLAHARDYKRLGDGNVGPNTGGMGAVSPSDDAPGLEEIVLGKVFQPMARELEAVGAPFHGVLFAGLMIGPDRQPRVLEFNARFGDPESQVILPRIKGDFYAMLRATARGELHQLGQIEIAPEYAVCVVGAAPGYPAKVTVGATVEGLAEQNVSSPNPKYFVGGVTKTPKGFAVKGGRVLGALGTGYSRDVARAAAYAHLKEISFPGMQFRNDIGAA